MAWCSTLKKAQQFGMQLHPGDIYHVLFLYHIEQNGCEIVKRLVRWRGYANESEKTA
jgi:hypothetical protein